MEEVLIVRRLFYEDWFLCKHVQGSDRGLLLKHSETVHGRLSSRLYSNTYLLQVCKPKLKDFKCFGANKKMKLKGQQLLGI